MKRRSPRLAVVLAALLALLAVVLAAAWQLTPRPARTLTLQVTSARGSSIPVTLTLPGRTGGGVPLVTPWPSGWPRRASPRRRWILPATAKAPSPSPPTRWTA